MSFIIYIFGVNINVLSRFCQDVSLTRDELDIDIELCGLDGSPTKVHKVDSVVLGSGDHVRIKPTKEEIRTLVDKLIEDRIFG